MCKFSSFVDVCDSQNQTIVGVQPRLLTCEDNTSREVDPELCKKLKKPPTISRTCEIDCPLKKCVYGFWNEWRDGLMTTKITF